MDKNVNYSKELDLLIQKNRASGVRPKLMLHVCCAVCASYVIEYLCDFFYIYIVYYNPNISSEEEYIYRKSELERYIREAGYEDKIVMVPAEYDSDMWMKKISGFEKEKEGGKRCSICFFDRLLYTKNICDEYKCDYFATTLTISPLKNAKLINEIGKNLGNRYLPTDFKKKNGYKRSIELSKEYDLYRQNYCGCIYSKGEADNRRKSD